jgi:hypothetical protein
MAHVTARRLSQLRSVAFDRLLSRTYATVCSTAAPCAASSLSGRCGARRVAERLRACARRGG